jgi:hypothetical protein
MDKDVIEVGPAYRHSGARKPSVFAPILAELRPGERKLILAGGKFGPNRHAIHCGIRAQAKKAGVKLLIQNDSEGVIVSLKNNGK